MDAIDEVIIPCTDRDVALATKIEEAITEVLTNGRSDRIIAFLREIGSATLTDRKVRDVYLAAGIKAFALEG